MRHSHGFMILPAAPDVLAAAHRLRGVIQHTPCSYSAPLSARAGAEIYLKWENQQHTGSFKLRGAFNALLTMPHEERRRGVVVSSAGNISIRWRCNWWYQAQGLRQPNLVTKWS